LISKKNIKYNNESIIKLLFIKNCLDDTNLNINSEISKILKLSEVSNINIYKNKLNNELDEYINLIGWRTVKYNEKLNNFKLGSIKSLVEFLFNIMYCYNTLDNNNKGWYCKLPIEWRNKKFLTNLGIIDDNYMNIFNKIWNMFM